ncbi:hypothetical protein [Pseudarthrobacter sp. N5]|uniref:hypothetical protein n=1 Tax=Pseudarthrobacter sp. N5 TaxID=3418416 RepID=UPI003CF7FD08
MAELFLAVRVAATNSVKCELPTPLNPDAAPPGAPQGPGGPGSAGVPDNGGERPDVELPSADAPLDESNTEETPSGRPFSSEPDA